MGTLSLAECEEGKEAQQWTVMEDGRIALTASNPRKYLELEKWKTVSIKLTMERRTMPRSRIHEGRGKQRCRSL